MYKILVNEAFIEMDASNVEIQSGTLIFYFDKEKTKVRAVVPAGWKYFEIMEVENAIQITKTNTVPQSQEAEVIKEEEKVDVSKEIDEISKETE